MREVDGRSGKVRSPIGYRPYLPKRLPFLRLHKGTIWNRTRGQSMCPILNTSSILRRMDDLEQNAETIQTSKPEYLIILKALSWGDPKQNAGTIHDTVFPNIYKFPLT